MRTGSFRTIIARESVAVYLGLVLAALIALPPSASPLTSLIALGAAGAFFALIRGAQSATPHHRSGAVLASLGIPALILLVAALGADSPAMSFLGSVGQRAGAATWVAAGALGIVLFSSPRSGEAGRTARAVGLFSAALSVAVLAEHLGLLTVVRGPFPPAGVLENSLTMGQVLVIGIPCTLAWALAVSDIRQRMVATCCLFVQGWAAIVVGSAGAWIGLVVALVGAAALYVLARAGRLRPRPIAIGVAVALLGAAALLVILLGPAEPAFIEEAFGSVSADRLPIWRSAVAAIHETPLLGRGPEQFSAIVEWDSDPGLSIEWTGTYDPHNVLLYLLLSGGVITLVVAVAAGSLLLLVALRPLSESPGLPRALLVGAVVGWLASLLFAWVGPLTLGLATLVVAPLVQGTGDRGRALPPRTGWLSVAAPAVVGLVIVGILVASGELAEYEAARALDATGRIEPALALEVASEVADPAYAATVARVAVDEASSNPNAAIMSDPAFSEVELVLKRDADWHVAAAVARFEVAVVRLQRGEGSGAWDEAGAALDAGHRADPETGLWDVYGAYRAAELGFDSEAVAYAQSALEYDLPDDVRAYLEAEFGVASGPAGN